MLTGWGRTAPTRASVVPVRSVEHVQQVIAAAGSSRRGVLARGLGRSYGDAAQSAGGTVLDLSALDGVSLDAAEGTVAAGAGVSLDALLRVLVPLGWTLPVLPGTRQVTVGGAVAADVHGKNHHVAGSFGMHVRDLDLVTADATLRTLSPAAADSDAYWATVAGMGLTGVITRATVALRPITSAWMRTVTQRLPDLDALMATMAASDADHPYSVAWVDAQATGARFGRGVLSQGDHADAGELPAPQRGRPLAYQPAIRLTAPVTPPAGMVRRSTARAFNELWFRRAPRRRVQRLEHMTGFFHPLDGVGEWSRLYGPGGLLQYQLVVPETAGEVVAAALRHLQSARAPIALTVLKRFGPASPAPLSFPRPGWTLALDMPSGTPGLARVLDHLDDVVASAGGRVYLAKDSRMSPESFSRMYADLPRWEAVRRRLDPQGLFGSDLSRRLMP